MHPYVFATVAVSVVVVGFVAYTVYNEILNEPIPVYARAGSNKSNSKDSDNEKDSDSDSSGRNSTGLRKRRKSTGKKSKSEKSINDSEEQEEQLLEKLSYLNVLEQELHSRAKEIENEERILKEKEQELKNRKQHLQSISSKSSSDSDLTNTPHITNTQTNTSATNTVLDNDSSDEISIKEVVEQHSLNNENSLYPDTSVQAILSQDLSIISSHHLQSSIDNANNNIIANNDGDNNNINETILQQNQQQHLHLFHALSPNPSEDAWSEIESINSEDIGSEMSSAVDIDMEEVDVIEH